MTDDVFVTVLGRGSPRKILDSINSISISNKGKRKLAEHANKYPVKQ